MSIAHSTINAATPAPHPFAEPLYELLIRDDPRLDDSVVDEHRSLETIQRLLSVSIVGSLFYGAGVGLAAQLANASMMQPFRAWLGPLPAIVLPVAMTAAFLVALAVCLPSFYFYTQLSGLDASFRLITAQALRVQARTSVLLLGVLPLYIAIVLAAVAGIIDGSPEILLLGLLLPFVVGLAGVASLHRSFARLARDLPVAHIRRPHFLSCMVLAWAVVYSVVCPVALYRIGAVLGTLLGG